MNAPSPTPGAIPEPPIAGDPLPGRFVLEFAGVLWVFGITLTLVTANLPVLWFKTRLTELMVASRVAEIDIVERIALRGTALPAQAGQIAAAVALPVSAKTAEPLHLWGRDVGDTHVISGVRTPGPSAFFVAFSPMVNLAGPPATVRWLCGRRGPHPGQPGPGTDLPDAYLPAACRAEAAPSP